MRHGPPRLVPRGLLPERVAGVVASGSLACSGLCLVALSALLVVLLLLVVGLTLVQAEGEALSVAAFMGAFRWFLSDVLGTSLRPGQVLLRLALPGIAGALLAVYGTWRTLRGLRPDGDRR